jgi:hypothetical protein
MTPAAATNGADAYRMSIEAAQTCGDFVRAVAQTIQGRKYLGMDGWQAIAAAHGCAASAGEVTKEEDGVRAIGEVRRLSDGLVIARGEGFAGKDEPAWFGGEMEVWSRQARRNVKVLAPKRPDFAIRAMAQTRAISRACRSAFAHVVVLIGRDLQTTPAEEMYGLHDGTGEGDWVSDARRDGLIKDGETRSQYQVDKLRTAVDNGWTVVNTTAKGKEHQLFAYLDMARHPDDVSAICRANEGLIAEAPYQVQFEGAVDRLLRRFEAQAAEGAP